MSGFSYNLETGHIFWHVGNYNFIFPRLNILFATTKFPVYETCDMFKGPTTCIWQEK